MRRQGHKNPLFPLRGDSNEVDRVQRVCREQQKHHIVTHVYPLVNTIMRDGSGLILKVIWPRVVSHLRRSRGFATAARAPAPGL